VIKVLVVDDSALMRKVLGTILRAAGDMEVAVARDGLEAVAQLHSFAPDVVTLDIHMPKMDGLACLDRIMIERPSRVVMVASLTAAGADVTLDAMALGAVDFVAKPEGVISLAVEAFAPVFLERVRAAAGNLFEALNPGGFVCLGHTESMSRISDRFTLRRFPDAIVFQRPGP
jgi:two-component system chemotaxis response regulator CheB